MTMFAIALLLAAQVVPMATSTPTPEAEALGLQLARTDTLRTLANLSSSREVFVLLRSQRDLSDEERRRLEAVAYTAQDIEVRRIFQNLAHYYAQTLSVEDLRALVAAQNTPSAKRMQFLQPGAIAVASALDTKAAVTATLCHENRTFCSPGK